MWRFLILALLGGVFSSACDAERPPCQQDGDCFVGEVCRQGSCFEVSPDARDLGDFGPDDSSSDLGDFGPNCLDDPGVCGDFACNTRTGECFPCEFDRQCGADARCETSDGTCACRDGFHRCGRTCVSDDDPNFCGSECRVCPRPENGDAICVEDQCAVDCDDGWLPCGDSCPTEEACVQCFDDSDCGPDAPTCELGLCVGCQEPEECERFEDAQICHSTGQCVECTPTERDACGFNSCDPGALECTDTPTRSKTTCDACVADEECPDDERCIWMNFDSARRASGYCLGLPDAIEGCPSKYPVRVDRVSASGFPRTGYCTINEDITTCEAVKGYGRPGCEEDDECGVPGVEDAVCRLFESLRRCTYPCDVRNECPGGAICATYCREE